MTRDDFERALDRLVNKLQAEASNAGFASSRDFEVGVRDALVSVLPEMAAAIDYNPHPHVFPDITIGEFGIEVKYTENDTWRSIANSVSETRRDRSVRYIYLVFGKMGGAPGVRWGGYEQCVMHVRTSHVPRFEVEMWPSESLFNKMGVKVLGLDVTMNHVARIPTIPRRKAGLP